MQSETTLPVPQPTEERERETLRFTFVMPRVIHSRLRQLRAVTGENLSAQVRRILARELFDRRNKGRII